MWSALIEVLDELEDGESARTMNLATRLPNEVNVPGQLDSYRRLGAIEKVGFSSWRLTLKGRMHAARMYDSQGMTREQWLSLKTAMSA